MLSSIASEPTPIHVAPVRTDGAKSFHFTIPAAISRLAVVGVLASLLTTAVMYSRAGSVAAQADPHASRQAFVQPKNRQVAEATFIPTERVAAVTDDKRLAVANVVPVARPRPVTPGYYYELVRAQGDGEDGEYVLVERQCVPKSDMPEPCYLPERGRQNFPLRSE